MSTVEQQRAQEGPSRTAVLRELRSRAGHVRVEELAGSVGLSLSAVRFHLDRLVADGLVRSSKEPRSTPGRPRVVYRAVPEEAVDDAAAYRRLSAVLAEALAVVGGAAAAESAGRGWASRLVADRAAAGVDPSDAAPGDPLAQVLRILDDGGLAPRVVEGGRSLELHRCPFEALMAEHSAAVCSVHRGMLAQLPRSLGDRHELELVPRPAAGSPCRVRIRPSRPQAADCRRR